MSLWPMSSWWPHRCFPRVWGWTQRPILRSWRRWWSPGSRPPLERGHFLCSRIVHPATPPETFRGGSLNTSLTLPHVRSGLQTRLTSNWWTIMCVAQLRGTQTKLPALPKRCCAPGSRQCGLNCPGTLSLKAALSSEGVSRLSLRLGQLHWVDQ